MPYPRFTSSTCRSRFWPDFSTQNDGKLHFMLTPPKGETVVCRTKDTTQWQNRLLSVCRVGFVYQCRVILYLYMQIVVDDLKSKCFETRNVSNMTFDNPENLSKTQLYDDQNVDTECWVDFLSDLYCERALCWWLLNVVGINAGKWVCIAVGLTMICPEETQPQRWGKHANYRTMC